MGKVISFVSSKKIREALRTKTVFVSKIEKSKAERLVEKGFRVIIR